jgi:hypothetical protein
LEEIVDHQLLPAAIKLSDQRIIHADGKTYLKRSTIGWQLCCQWKDDSTSWENLADFKKSYPIETAKYATILDIDHEPAFNWWVPHALKKRDCIISLVRKWNPHHLKHTHKFGIDLPKTIKEALELDKKNGNTFWADAIAKETKDICVAFKILLDGLSAPIGYQKIPCHMIFDIKMEDFQSKARLVAGGHMTKAPATSTYVSVVSCETVHIALLMAALNDPNVKVGDVLNAYITALITKKVWTVLGHKFGIDANMSAIILCPLYQLKSAGAAFGTYLASFMRQMGYTSCKADPDLWYKAETRPADNIRYYARILCHVNNILCFHHDPMSEHSSINGYMPLKQSSVGDPDIYLGAKLKMTQLDNGIWA